MALLDYLGYAGQKDPNDKNGSISATIGQKITDARAGRDPSILGRAIGGLANFGEDIRNNTPINQAQSLDVTDNIANNIIRLSGNNYVGGSSQANQGVIKGGILKQNNATTDYLTKLAQQQASPNQSQPQSVQSNGLLRNNQPFAPTANNNPNFVPNNVQQTRDALGNLPSFTPERNQFALDARQRYDNSFNSLLNNYNDQVNTNDNSLAGIFNQIGRRSGLLKELGLVSTQLNTNNQLAASDISNTNQLNLQDLQNQRAGVLGLGQLQQSQNQGINAQDLGVAQLNASINNSNNDSAIKNTELQAKLPLLEIQKQIGDTVLNGSTPESVGSQRIGALLQSPDGQALVSRYTQQTDNPQQAIQLAAQDLATIEGQNKFKSLTTGATGILNPASFANLGAKETPVIKSGPDGTTVEGKNINDVLKIQQLIRQNEKDIKDGKVKTLVDPQTGRPL